MKINVLILLNLIIFLFAYFLTVTNLTWAQNNNTLSPKTNLSLHSFQQIYRGYVRTMTTPYIKNRYVYNKTYWLEKFFAFNQEEIVSRYGVSTYYGFFFYYCIYYVRHELGPEFFDDFLKIIALSGTSKEKLKEIMRLEDEKELIQFIIDKYISLSDESEITAQQMLNNITQIMKDYRLDIFEQKKIRAKFKQQARRAYELIGKDSDREREEIVRAFSLAYESELSSFTPTRLIFYPTLTCDTRCAFCTFAYKKLSLLPTAQRKKLYGQAIAYARKEYNIENTLILGGEVLKYAKKDMLNILETIEGNFLITSNGDFAKDLPSTENMLRNILEKVQASQDTNPKAKIFLQVSFDSFHQEVKRKEKGILQEKIPIANIANIIQTALCKFPQIKVHLIRQFEPLADNLIEDLKTEFKSRNIYLDFEETPPTDSGFFYEDPDHKIPQLIKNKQPVRLFDENRNLISPNRFWYSYIFPVIEGMAELIPFYKFGYHVKKNFATTPVILVCGDGNVYLSNNTFSCRLRAGNMAKDSLDTIIKTAKKDLLAVVLDKKTDLAISLAQEVIPDLQEKLNQEYYPRQSFFTYLKNNPALRLYLTKRLIQISCEGQLIGREVMRKLKWVNNFTINELKWEYIKNFIKEQNLLADPKTLLLPHINDQKEVEKIVLNYEEKRMRLVTAIPAFTQPFNSPIIAPYSSITNTEIFFSDAI